MFHGKHRALAIAVAVAGLASTLSLPAARGADEKAVALALKSAISRYAAGEYDGAADAARAALEEDPTNARALDLLARALAAEGEDEAAAADLRKRIEAHPDRFGPALALADLIAERAPEEAIALYRRAREVGGPLYATAAGIAQALVALGRAEEAEKEIRAAFDAYRVADDEALAAADWRALARAALAAEHVAALRKEHARPFAKDARDFYQRAWRVADKDPDILVEWGDLFLEKWDLPEARRLAKEALKGAPRHAAAQVLLAETYLRDLYGGAKGYDAAREAIGVALETNPRCARAYVLHAELVLTDGLFDEAIADLEKALALRPLDVRAAGTIAGIAHARGEAARYAAVEAEVKKRGKRALAELYTRVAAVLDGRFRYADAYTVAKQAVEADPEHWPAYAQLGLAAMRAGDEETAESYLEKAVEADPFDIFAANLLMLLRYLEREFETIETEHFVLRLHKSERKAFEPEIVPLLERSYEELTRRYGVKMDTKVLFEVFPQISDFSVRAVAHRFIPASGVTFARVVALASPRALPSGTHAWGRVLWHEMAHVVTLERSRYRVPRWLTEGISVYEESKGHPAWTREWDEMVVDALARGRLLPIRELNLGFSKPRFPNQVMLSYYQGGLICQFIEKEWGFPAILALLDGYRDGKPLERNLADALGGIAPEEFDRRFLAFVKGVFAMVRYRAPCREERELAALRKAARERPSDPEVLARYGLAAADMRRMADAETTAGRLEKIDPESGDARLVRALVAQHRRQPEKAVELAADALARGTSDPLAANLLIARYYGERPREKEPRRDLQKAIAALEAAHACFPRAPGPMQELVALYEEAGDSAKRFAMLEKLAAALPNDAGPRIQLAERAWDLGDGARLRALVDEAMLIDALSPSIHALDAAACAMESRFEEGRRALATAESLLTDRRQRQALAPLLARVEKLLAAGGGGGSAPEPGPESEPRPAPTPEPEEKTAPRDF